jgi:hypothetical protein
VFVKSYESGVTTQRVGPLELFIGTRFQAWLRWRNLLHGNIYVSVNAISPHQRSRTREAVAAIRHVFLDVDDDGPETLAAIAARKDVPPPSYVLRTSPRRMHILWRVCNFSIKRLETLQKQLAHELRTDRAATACSQMTRLPGFINHKRQGHLVSVAYRDVARLYTPADFPAPAATQAVATIDHCGRQARSWWDPVDRARRYMNAMQPAIAGQYGDLHTFRVCCRLVRGFALCDHEALDLLIEWNRRCEPPWSERELLDKLRRARRYGVEPIGGLLQGQPRVLTARVRVTPDPAPEVM